MVLPYPDAPGNVAASALITKAEAATLLRCTGRFVDKLIAAGSLPAYKVGARMVRLRRADVDALLRPILTGDDAA